MVSVIVQFLPSFQDFLLSICISNPQKFFSMGLVDECEEFFGTTDLFQIFELEKDCDEKKIKKAYYKLSLKFHPDKCSVSDREENTKKFQCLGKIHKILR